MWRHGGAQPAHCVLAPGTGVEDQIGEWRALVDHQVELDRVDGGYAVTFDAAVSPLVEDLARREAACCGFLDIVLTSRPNGVRLTVTSPNPDALPVIRLLVGVEG
ncbi:MAG: hypothetical protein ACRDU9_07730 [Acidimicrobiia bacterium]